MSSAQAEAPIFNEGKTVGRLEVEERRRRQGGWIIHLVGS